MSAPPRRLRADLPFRRLALVLSGGGALGAYEVGVLKVIEALGLVPATVAGVSIGAVNATVWLAHGRRIAVLERVWRGLRPEHIGLRWIALALRAGGGLAAAIGLTETLLALLGSREMSGAYWFWKKSSARFDLWSAQLDITLWLLVGVAGLAILLLGRPIEGWLAGAEAPGDPARGRALLGRVALGAAAVHALVWAMGWPWPHRFSALVVLALLAAWLGSGPGHTGRWMRRMGLSLMPETGGRGLWGGRARRKLLQRLVREGDAKLLTGSGTGLVIGALAVDTGRMTHFVSWPDPSPEFRRRVEIELGEVVTLRDADEVIAAAVASSAIPGVFEPERFAGREFVDGGGFSNQPLHVVIAADADAVLVVLLSPSGSPAPSPPPADLFSLAGRLLEVANWRDLQTELRSLPAGWSREGNPARVCVVEPERALPGTVLGFDPRGAAQLIELGEADAWRALEAAGWLAPRAEV